jgi:hypothetical protein
MLSFTASADEDVDQTIHSPIGFWKTVDDVTGRVRSIINIYEGSDHLLYGKIVRTFPTPGVTPLKTCSACDGERKDKPILGLVIMSRLKLAEDRTEWKGGEILDPSNGKTYHVNLRVLSDNDSMKVRGYIGLPLLGRTQTWIRTHPV